MNKITLKITDSCGYWSVTRDMFEWLCKHNLINHTIKDWEEAEKKSIYDIQKGTTCKEKDELSKEVDNFVKNKLSELGLFLASFDVEPYEGKEYRQHYLLPLSLNIKEIKKLEEKFDIYFGLREGNAIASFGDYNTKWDNF